ncbi:hypothetical protein HHL17_08375 [Chitinophaga sp. G-6-1-13]|uniref:PH domain-containing protein n=1 Tax=Chitinophaga fulva TaxID=2728842 RepID=A0A848GFF4_9BACT|nr:hypothetical protein [Chitinophaga fulva]NML37214.1 hypothetical protein [Chitinophaga fulva]
MMGPVIKQKEFRFQGLDYRTEIWLGLSIIPVLAAVLVGTFYLVRMIFPLDLLRIPRGIIIGIILGISFLSLKWMVKLVHNRTWIVNVDDDRLLLQFGKRRFDIPLGSIRRIENMGNVGFRYLSFVTQEGLTVRIRVGATAMTPFSTAEDVQTVDDFIRYLKPYIDKHFNKKVLRNKINQNPFPHYGVYVVKSDPLRYNLFEKMTPGQVILVIFTSGVVFLILLLQVLFYFIDKKH